MICGIFGLLWNTKWTEEKSHIVKIKSAEDITDQYFLQYFSLFVLFAVPLDISYFNEFCIYILVLLFIGIVYIKCGTYYINPLLNILGYRFYNVTLKSLETGKIREVKIFFKSKIEKSNYEIKILNDNFAFIVGKVNSKPNSTKKQKNIEVDKIEAKTDKIVNNQNELKTNTENTNYTQ